MVFVRPRLPPIITALIGVTLLLSLLAVLDARAGGSLYDVLALVPARVWRGELWRLITWPLVATGPWSLGFTCVGLYWFGGQLVAAWGADFFARYLAAVLLFAAAATTTLALILPAARTAPHLGGWALDSALVIAWALQFPERRVRVWGLLVVGGELLAYGTVAFTGLCVIYYGLAAFLPELLAGGAALAYMTGALGRWRARAQRRHQRRNLHVVPDRDDPRMPN